MGCHYDGYAVHRIVFLEADVRFVVQLCRRIACRSQSVFFLGILFGDERGFLPRQARANPGVFYTVVLTTSAVSSTNLVSIVIFARCVSTSFVRSL